MRNGSSFEAMNTRPRTLLQKLSGDAERMVVRSHEHPPLQVDHSVRDFSFLTLIQPPSRHVRRIIRGTKHAPRRTISVPLNHLEVVEDLALVPNVIAGSDDVNIEFEQLFGQRRRNAETRGRILSIRNDDINRLVADNSRQPILDDQPSRPSKNVADKENPH